MRNPKNLENIWSEFNIEIVEIQKNTSLGEKINLIKMISMFFSMMKRKILQNSFLTLNNLKYTGIYPNFILVLALHLMLLNIFH
jgi:hypothetical protein